MRATYTAYICLGVAIVMETLATSFLARSEQFTRLGPSVLTALGYIGSFYMLSHALKIIPVGIAYALWSGVGIVLVTVIGLVAFRQHLDVPAYIGMALILAGVVVIHAFSRSVQGG